jgi:enoyl-CoA hydratase/carnithine racemase
MSNDILFSFEERVATILLNRPQKLNAVTPEMATMIVEATERCNKSDDVRCVVIGAAGDRAFCAGSDIGELDSYSTPWSFRNRQDYCDAIRRLRKPSIAAVNGYAFGGGLETALSCDIRIASANAQFAAPEIKLGWIGGGGMTAFLTHAIGASNAAFMVLTGDPIDAQRALAWGLVSEVVETGAALGRAQEIARVVASRAPIAAETAKLNLQAALSMPIEKAIEYERDLQTICFATDDAKEGRAAFKERRQPEFKRR